MDELRSCELRLCTMLKAAALSAVVIALRGCDGCRIGDRCPSAELCRSKAALLRPGVSVYHGCASALHPECYYAVLTESFLAGLGGITFFSFANPGKPMNGALLSLVPTLSLRVVAGRMAGPRMSVPPSVVRSALARFCLGVTDGFARLLGGVTARRVMPGTETSSFRLGSIESPFSSTSEDFERFSDNSIPILKAAAFDKRG